MRTGGDIGAGNRPALPAAEGDEGECEHDMTRRVRGRQRRARHRRCWTDAMRAQRRSEGWSRCQLRVVEQESVLVQWERSSSTGALLRSAVRVEEDEQAGCDQASRRRSSQHSEQLSARHERGQRGGSGAMRAEAERAGGPRRARRLRMEGRQGKDGKRRRHGREARRSDGADPSVSGKETGERTRDKGQQQGRGRVGDDGRVVEGERVDMERVDAG